MRYLAVALTWMLATSAQAQSENGLLRSGNRQYEKENYAASEAEYKKALTENATNEIGVFNLGDAMFMQERFEDARAQFELSSNLFSSEEEKAKAFHNMGNTFMAESKWQESVQAYKQALKLQPGDMETKYNLAYANRMLKQQQQQDQNQDQNQDQENQDQQDQQEQNQENQQDQEQQQQDQNQDQQANEDREGEQKEEQQANKEGAEERPLDQLSKEEAERILQALMAEEQKLQEKLQKQQRKAVRVQIEKDW